MKTILLLISIMLLGAVTAVAQHSFPLPLDKANSMEVLAQGQPELTEEAVPLDGWRNEGLGQLFQGKELRLLVPITTGKRAVGQPGDIDYCTYGQVSIVKDMHERDLNIYNKVVMDVLPQCKGKSIMNLNLYIANDTYADVGAHLINLTPNEWNHVEFDMSGLPRERVSQLRIYTDVKGRNLFEGDSLTYTIRNFRLQQVAHSTKEIGWDVAEGEISYSMSGYYPESEKKAMLGFAAKEFEIKDAQTGKTVKKGKVTQQQTTIGTFYVADFSDLKNKGTYILDVEGKKTRPFSIGYDTFNNSMWNVLNYIYCQRCGAAVEGIHGVCHEDLFSVHNGKKTSYAGGWHDAGDLSQQTLQSGDVAFALAEAYSKQNGELAQRLKDEAFHGYRFILRQRLGDGWHASSMGLLHWTDGIVGTDDDIVTVRTQDNSFDNFLYAGYEAYAALVFADDGFADSLRRAAIEDFHFAKLKFDARGLDAFQHMMEHTYSTSHSLYMAVMSWSASQLYRLTQDERYAKLAVEYIQLVLDCQAKEGTRDELAGFFYRDESRKALVHSIHQSREQFFAMALAELMNTQSQHKDYAKWKQAAILLGNYLKSLRPYNEAILLADGKAAAVLGNLLGDESLLEMGRQQLYWTVGANPFCQSLIYGEGHNYPSMDSFSSGEITGEMPVGIRAKGNSDIPYWPQTNNACYKEVWVTSAGKWMSLLSEF